jgi:NADH dehydrogenase
MRILILGASGFIGTYLSRFATEQQHTVIGLCRSGVIANFDGTVLKWELGQAIPLMALQHIDCAIHLAHDFSGEIGAELTRNATLANVRQLQEAGVARQLFFSSYSAHKNTKSLYGRTKFAIEQSVRDDFDTVIVRPGLVLGEGGLYGRIQNLVRIFPIIPLPNGGRGVTPVIELKRLSLEALKLAGSESFKQEANLFEHELISLKQLVLRAANNVNKIPRILPIPSSLVLIGLKLANVLRIPLPINEDNLAGFLANQTITHVSSL